MIFKEAINIVGKTLSQVGTTINADNYDGVIVKKLAASNTLDAGRTTNQTHIAITGVQMDIFPYLCADGYFFEENKLADVDLKKYFVIRVPIVLHESNLHHLGYEGYDFSFNNGVVHTTTSVVRSKRGGQADQLQVSMLDMDGEHFVAFRKLLHEGYYLLLLKHKAAMSYDAVGINPSLISDNGAELSQLNNQFFKLPTNTVVDSSVFNNPKDREIIADAIPSNLTVEDLGRILADMYNNASAGNQSNAIRMFGIKYGGVITENNYSASGVVKASGINSSYDAEVSKGISIYKSIRDNEYGIRFADENAEASDVNDTKLRGGFNKIYYGAPGCGKSFIVNKMLNDANVPETNRIRVTFHPEYANCDFVGQILPTIEKKFDAATGEEKEVVKYIFNPGPFTLALERARKTNDMVYLVIEEINRGNAAAIFGDLFQLLDREKDMTKPNWGESEYPICNVNIQKYLGVGEGKSTVIPSNLTILATMNTSDQSVFTLDTAFKRRWSFEQISNNIEKDTKHEYKGWYVPGTSVTLERFLTVINAEILKHKITSEDKRMGKYFISKDCLTETPCDIQDAKMEAEMFAYKVLEYIWNDVCKIGKDEWFDTISITTLEDLIEAFVEPESDATPLSVFKSITF